MLGSAVRMDRTPSYKGFSDVQVLFVVLFGTFVTTFSFYGSSMVCFLISLESMVTLNRGAVYIVGSLDSSRRQRCRPVPFL